MRGKWAKALATIVESPDAPAGATESAFSPGRGLDFHQYLVEVTGPGGQVVRGVIGLVSLFVRAVGEPMAVEVNFKTGELRLDRTGMALILRQQAASHREAALLAIEPDDAAPGGHQAGSAEERLTRLADLRDKGLLTDTEYQARRDRIIGEL